MFLSAEKMCVCVCVFVAQQKSRLPEAAARTSTTSQSSEEPNCPVAIISLKLSFKLLILAASELTETCQIRKQKKVPCSKFFLLITLNEY